jgi:hypothetical protein
VPPRSQPSRLLLVATQLADSPPEQAPSGTAPGAEAPAPPLPPEPGVHGCAKCGARMAGGQDWCLQCGAGAAGSVGGGGWRSLATVLGVTAALLLGAAAAGYAALSKKSRHAPVVTKTVAQVTTAPLTTATTPGLTATTPTTPLPGVSAKPPKIPVKAATPTPAAPAPTTTPTTPATTTPTGNQNNSGTGGSKTPEEKQPEALLLDTNAASTYDPYAYPASWFGDPSLAIDGDTTTGWSAQVNPATAPALAEGLVIDLKSPHKLSAVKLVTSTPGMTVQVYGSAAKRLPTSITDPAWVPLSRSITVKKHHARLGLRNQAKSYRFVTLWISKAPASAAGTPEAPGKVTIDELELLPA